MISFLPSGTMSENYLAISRAEKGGVNREIRAAHIVFQAQFTPSVHPYQPVISQEVRAPARGSFFSDTPEFAPP